MVKDIFVWICLLSCVNIAISQYANRMHPANRGFSRTFTAPAGFKSQQLRMYAPIGFTPFVRHSLLPRRERSLSLGREISENMSEMKELRQETMELMGDRGRLYGRPLVRQMRYTAPTTHQRMYSQRPYRLTQALPVQRPRKQTQYLTQTQRVSRKRKHHFSGQKVLVQPNHPNQTRSRLPFKGRNKLVLTHEQAVQMLRQLKKKIGNAKKVQPMSNTNMKRKTMTKEEKLKGLNGVMEWIERIASLNRIPATSKRRDSAVGFSNSNNRQNVIPLKHVVNQVNMNTKQSVAVPRYVSVDTVRYQQRKLPQRQYQQQARVKQIQLGRPKQEYVQQKQQQHRYQQGRRQQYFYPHKLPVQNQKQNKYLQQVHAQKQQATNDVQQTSVLQQQQTQHLQQANVQQQKHPDIRQPPVQLQQTNRHQQQSHVQQEQRTQHHQQAPVQQQQQQQYQQRLHIQKQQHQQSQIKQKSNQQQMQILKQNEENAGTRTIPNTQKSIHDVRVSVPAQYHGRSQDKRKQLHTVVNNRNTLVYTDKSTGKPGPIALKASIILKLAKLKATVKKPTYVKIGKRMFLVMPRNVQLRKPNKVTYKQIATGRKYVND